MGSWTPGIRSLDGPPPSGGKTSMLTQKLINSALAEPSLRESLT